MTLIPRRSISTQIADELRAEIAKGTWQEWLPGERSLHETLQASRNSVRAAIQQLKAEGLIESVEGIGNRLCKNVRRSRLPSRITNVGALLSTLSGSARMRLEPATVMWERGGRVSLA